MTRAIASIVCVLLGSTALSQEAAQPVVIGETLTIDSRVLDEARRIYVSTPPSYERGTQRYGVVYVLDAETQFQHTVTSARFLGEFGSQTIPPLLVVGIGNTDRMRDMTPASAVQENSLVAQGGADAFLRFIAGELKPWVDEHYRTSGYSVLIGHSLGGLLAVYALVSETDAFDGYLAIDPSLNWNDQALVRRAREFVNGNPDVDTSLYVAASDLDGPAVSGIRNLVEMLDISAPGGLRWDFSPIVAESHGTIPLPGIYRGLRWLFAGWDVGDEAEAKFSSAPADEIFEEIDALYRSSGARFGYERVAPYPVFESLLAYLAESGRVAEAAALTLNYSNRYPLPLVPNVIAGIAQLFVADGNEDAARDYLSAVLDLYPGNQTARQALTDLGITPADE